MISTDPLDHPATTSETREKATVLAVLAVLFAVVLSPVRHHWTRNPVDSFPLSYYPMFSARRRSTTRVVHAVGVRADGSRLDLSYKLCGEGGFNQTRRQIRRIVVSGQADVLARRVATAVSARRSRRLADVVAVEIVTGKYRYDSFFAGDRTPVSEIMHARCDVPGRSGQVPSDSSEPVEVLS